MKEIKGRIIFVSDLDFSLTGNQTLINVVIGTVRNGYSVDLLSSSPLPKNSDSNKWIPADVRDKIRVYRFKPLVRRYKLLFNNFQFINDFLNLIRKKSFKNDISKFNYETTYTPFSYYPSISFASFFFGGLLPLIKLCKKNSYKKVCGYEPRGIILGYFASQIFKLTFYKRFQGIILYPELKNTIRLYSKYFFYFLSVKVPASYTFMGNDGTYGDKVLDWFGVEKKKYSFRINGYDKKIIFNKNNSDINIDQYGLLPEDIILLSVSRLEYWKRVDRIIYAFASSQKVCPNLKYIIVGGGPEFERLKALSALLGVEKKIIFTNRKPHSFVSSFIKRADIFASCYEHSNMANPVIESCLCGKPIISINDGTTKDILIDNYNCLLADKNNIIADLTSNLIKLSLDENLRKNLASNSLKVAKEKIMSWDERMKLEENEI